MYCVQNKGVYRWGEMDYSIRKFLNGKDRAGFRRYNYDAGGLAPVHFPVVIKQILGIAEGGASVSGLPTILPGIDISSGLARVAGNEKLYVRLLRQVATDASKIREDLLVAVRNGDVRATREVAHSLKGAAGNLAITNVAEEAAGLEEAAKEENIPAMVRRLDSLEIAMCDYVAVVKELGG